MELRYSLAVDPKICKLGLNVQIGQVFRWQVHANQRMAWGVDGEAGYLIRVRNDQWDVQSNQPEARLRRLFRLDEDYAALTDQAQALDPGLAPLFARMPGLVLLRQSDVVETLFSFLCTSNNNIGRITAMVHWLESQGVLMWECEGHEFRRFPTLEVLASLPESAYREASFGYRGASIPVAASQILENGGAAWLESLKTCGYAQARCQLLTLSGVGPKLADCICLFGLRYDEAVPLDVHMWRAACEHLFPDLRGTSLTERRREAVQKSFFEKYGQLAGLVHQAMFVNQLWRSRDRIIDW